MNTSVVKKSSQELFDSSDAVVVGVVIGKPTAKRTPGPKTDAMPKGEPMIVSTWTVVVNDVLKGDPPSRVMVELDGGSTDDLVVDIVDEAKFSPGEKVLLYLTAKGDVFRVNGLFQGKYSLRDDGSLVNRDSNLNTTLGQVKNQIRERKGQ